MIKRVVIIGTGNVSWMLAHSLPLFGYCVVQIVGRHEEKAQSLALEIGADYTSHYDEIYPNAEYYIYAVTDNAIAEVASNVPTNSGIHIHTSGSVGIEVFEGTKSNYGVLYPLQTFTRGKKIDFGKVAIFIEANNRETLESVEEFAKKLSLKVFDTNSRQRRSVHLAAVVGCNFANYLWQMSDTILKEHSFPFRDVMLPLVEESIDKLKYMSPKQAQTGPALRGDTQTIDKHLAMLNDNPQWQEIYKLLTAQIGKKE